MDIVQALSETVESAAIDAIAKTAIDNWRSNDEADKNLLIDSELTFQSHKFCFQSALSGEPYFETTYSLTKGGEEIGLYKLFTSTHNEAIDDYYEIY